MLVWALGLSCEAPAAFGPGFHTSEAVRNVMDEGKKFGAVDFFIGGDIDIELKLEPGDENLEGLDGIDWYGINGSECLGSGEDVITYEKKLWWLQLLRDFDCTVTSTWVDVENLGEFVACLGFGVPKETS